MRNTWLLIDGEGDKLSGATTTTITIRVWNTRTSGKGIQFIQILIWCHKNGNGNIPE